MPRVIDAFTQFFDDDGEPLVNGFLAFKESGTNNTDKNTYADINETIANANPVPLDGAGRCPNVFGTGTYNVISYAEDVNNPGNPGQQIQQFDPVNIAATEGQLSDWNSATTYNIGDLVIASDGGYYRSLTNNNENQDPTVSAGQWEEIKVIGIWNINVTYSIGDLVKASNGFLYKSNTDSNIGNSPATDDTNWSPISPTVATGIIYASSANSTKEITAGNDGQVPAIDAGGASLSYWTPNGHINGLILSNDTDTDHDINITAGEAADSTNGYILKLTSEITKQIDAAWAAGDDAGGMAATVTKTGTFTTVTTTVTGVGSLFLTEFSVGDVLYSSSNLEARKITAIASDLAMTLESGFTVDVTVAENVQKNGLAPNTWYHTQLIRKDSDGTIDAFFDTSVTAANISTGYTAYRRIGSVLTDASANILPFEALEIGGAVKYQWLTAISDYSSTFPTSGTNITLSVPTGYQVEVNALFRGDGGGIAIYATVGHPSTADYSTNLFRFVVSNVGTTTRDAFELAILTNSSAQIRVDADAAGTSLRINTWGWTDPRG